MASIRRIWWFNVVIITTTFMSLELSLCKKMTFEIQRRPNNLQVDTIPNDFTINNNGEWVEQNGCSANNCHRFNARKISGNCRCACEYAYSTFRMGASALNSSCIENSKIRSDEGCTILFENEAPNTNALTAIDTTRSDKENVVLPSNSRCNTSGSALYWDYGVWKSLHEDIFSINIPASWQKYFQWKRTTKYSGRIVKQPMICTSISTSQTSRHCIIFKIFGKISYDLNSPPTKVPTTSSTRSTIKTQQQKTTKKPTTKKATTKSTTTYQTIILSPKPTTEQSTTNGQTTQYSLRTTHISVDASTIPVTTTERHRHSTNEIGTTTTENIPTETSEMPATEITEQSTTGTDVVPGKKGARGASSDSESDNTLVITAIGATAAIACVIIICIFLWFVVKRKQNNRNNETYSTDMTVITNGTGMNNASASPTFKNPICDAVYCEPTEKHHPKQLPMLGNPVYDKAIVVNNNNNKEHQNNKQPSHKPKTKYDNNHYDNKDDDEAYDNAGYQDLVIKHPKNTANNADYGDSIYDNTYAEPEKPVYEALSANNGKDSIYQPLVHMNNKNTDMGAPEYLTLVNENTSPEIKEMPEYLTLLGDESNQTQPETREYDYAYADGQEKPTTLKAPNTRGVDMSQQDPQINNGPSDNGPPLYDVLEDPGDQGPPVYDVLEDPNGQGPPVYDVLEDPNGQGPPVYDVLEDPNGQGPSVYDVLEDPGDEGPPVYDVLEGPDSGDDYLMPVEGK